MPDKRPVPRQSLSRARWLKEKNLQQLLRTIANAGGEARVAGGAVRNALLGEAVTEVDIATNLPPDRVDYICTAAKFRVHPTGIDHGTVTVVVHGQPFEITTLRTDIATDGRRATVKFTDDWQQDAARRDFTINAMYVDATGKIYDYTNSYKDIKTRKVKFVGSPDQRIKEDYLRILRFFRFHARYGKGAPDAAGLAACKRLCKGMSQLSAERVRQEVLKLLAAPRAVATLKAMAKSGILGAIIPHTDEWRIIERIGPDPVLRLAILAKDPAALKNKLRLANGEANRIASAIDAPVLTPALRPAEQRRILFDVGASAWHDAVLVSWARSRASMSDPKWRKLLQLAKRWTRPILPVTGNDLKTCGVEQGPALGETLRRLQDYWIASDFKPTREELLKKVTP